MDTPAIIMMIVALVTVWGGMIAAIIHLSRNPEENDSTGPEADGHGG